MKRNNGINWDKLNSKCELLESMGFEILHMDSRVSFLDMEFDFSATAADIPSIMYTALRQMQMHGISEGEKCVQYNIKKALGLVCDED